MASKKNGHSGAEQPTEVIAAQQEQEEFTFQAFLTGRSSPIGGSHDLRKAVSIIEGDARGGEVRDRKGVVRFRKEPSIALVRSLRTETLLSSLDRSRAAMVQVRDAAEAAIAQIDKDRERIDDFGRWLEENEKRYSR